MNFMRLSKNYRYFKHQKVSIIFRFFLMGWVLFFVMPDAARACGGGSDDVEVIPVGGCEVYYYGLEGKVDYAKAFKCFQDAKSYEMLILMYLNGEGVSADVKKAEALLNTEKTKIYQGYAKVLQEAINKRKNSPKAQHQPLHFCDDLAGNYNYEEAFLCYAPDTYCLELNNNIAAAKLETFQTRIKASLYAAEATLLMKVIKSFDAFMEAEIEREMLSESVLGDPPSRLSVLFNDKLVLSTKIQNDFLKLLKDVVEQRNLNADDEQAYAAADKLLNQVYRKDISDYMNNEEFDRDDETKDLYKKQSKKTQLAWIKYRDLWAKLTGLLYKNQTKIQNPETSIKTALTNIRIDELKNI